MLPDSPLIALEEIDPDTYIGVLPSPCINVCRINQATGLCEGCWRTIDEIAQWRCASEVQKRVVWRAIKQRTHQS